MHTPANPGVLMVVATPLGNLGDLSQRAKELLAIADAVFCEDTRHSRTLFSANELPSKGRLHALHQHNEASQCQEIVDRVARGELVVLISDAGTPGISDPGVRVVAAVVEAGLQVSTAPGPSAVVAALSVSGLPTERFCMEGFVPRKAGERKSWYEVWASEERTIVFYESPQRIQNTLRELAEYFPQRRVVVVRELTKLHEEILRGTLAEVSATLSERDVLGEIVVVLEGAEVSRAADATVVRAALLDQLDRGVSVRDAVNEVVRALGGVHRDTYELALRLRSGYPQ
jgi:16S rRNA (cytidine1402-2'-O)-methyltransferase